RAPVWSRRERCRSRAASRWRSRSRGGAAEGWRRCDERAGTAAIVPSPCRVLRPAPRGRPTRRRGGPIARLRTIPRTDNRTHSSMPLTLRTLKRTALNGLRASGVYRLVENSSWRRNRLLILCYHGIAIEEEHRWRPSLFMSLPDFRSRLQVLERGKYNVLPLGEAVDRLYAGELPERSVAITFDDGNFDFYQQAFPLLREHGFPATVYLHSFYCINQYPIFRLICSYMLWRQ